jgi:hypothetical protein
MMGRGLRWERSRFIGRPKLNFKHEKEWLNNDRAARWLERVEKEQAKRMRWRASKKSPARRSTTVRIVV